jgi:hypothetical protein
MRHLLHDGLVGVVTSILKEVGVPDATVVVEARGLRAADRSKPDDYMALDFFAQDMHLVIDAVVTTMCMNTFLQKVASIPGYAAKQAEDRKFQADRISSHPIATPHGGPHVLVPFAMEDGGRLGAHAQALPRALAVTAIAKEPPGGEETRGRFAWDGGVALGTTVAAATIHLVAFGPLASSHSPPLSRNNIGAIVHLN